MAFKNPITAGEELILTGLRSQDYQEALTGWRIGADGNAQFYDLQVTNDLAASALSTPQITLDGHDLAETLDSKIRGIVSYDNHFDGTYDTASTVGTTETALIQIIAPEVTFDRLYLLHISFHLVASVGTDHWDMRVRYTNDGSTPSLTSSIMRIKRIGAISAGAAAASVMVDYFKYFTGAGPFRGLITLQRAFGTGTAYIYNEGDSNRSFVWSLVDLGKFNNASVGGTALVAKESPGTPDPDPIVQYGPYAFYTQWSQSYADLAQITDNGDMYQGRDDTGLPYHMSIAGFDYAAIQAMLAGATYISCQLRFTPKWLKSGVGGLDVRINGHNYTAKPTTVSLANISQNIIPQQANKSAGVTYTVELGATAFNNFKSGLWKGIGFGPGVTPSEYGRMYGQGALSNSVKPILSFTFTK